MSIEAGVQFLFAKAPVYKDFPIPFNESRLYGNRDMVAEEPFCFIPFGFSCFSLFEVFRVGIKFATSLNVRLCQTEWLLGLCVRLKKSWSCGIIKSTTQSGVFEPRAGCGSTPEELKECCLASPPAAGKETALRCDRVYK